MEPMVPDEAGSAVLEDKVLTLVGEAKQFAG